MKFTVFITAHDAARISKNLGLEPLYFLNNYPAGINSKFPAFKLKGKKYLLGLDNKDGKMKTCKFLMNVGGPRKCGVYDSRPVSCRTYPFFLENRKLNSVEEFVCPRQWWPEGKEREEYIKNINQFKKELEEYKKIVEIWNSNYGESSSFMKFLDFILNKVKI